MEELLRLSVYLLLTHPLHSRDGRGDCEIAGESERTAASPLPSLDLLCHEPTRRDNWAKAAITARLTLAACLLVWKEAGQTMARQACAPSRLRRDALCAHSGLASVAAAFGA